MAITPDQLSAKRRRAAHIRWAFEPDRLAATAPGRKAAADRFERTVDPELKLSPDERAKRAANLRSAFYSELGQRSAAARRARARGAK